MYIKTLELSDFRNYDNLSINFGQDTNILYGDNAQGKTNVLESVYLAATTRSHRGSKDKEIIRFGKEEAHIKMIVMKNEVPVRIDMHLKKNKPKGIAVNGIPLKRASELFGILNVVFFSPEDLNVIKNGPAERRKFIDTELCQLDKIYLHDLISYGKILNQRNRLLKDIVYAKGGHELFDTLDIWDMQMAQYGENIIEKRIFVCINMADTVSMSHDRDLRVVHNILYKRIRTSRDQKVNGIMAGKQFGNLTAGFCLENTVFWKTRINNSLVNRLENFTVCIQSFTSAF